MLRVVSPRDLVATLDRARAGVARPVLAFDADGTLWSGDVGIDLFEALLRRRAVRREAAAALSELSSRFGVAASDEPNEQARHLYAAFEAGTLPEDVAYTMMAWAFAGHATAELASFVERVLADVRLDERMHAEVAPVLAWARSAGVPVWVVSASPRAVVAAGVAKLGIAPSQVLAMTPLVAGDRVGPSVVPPITYGPGKVAALEAAAPGAEIVGAFGDNGFDVALLSRARVPVAVRPKPPLLARAAEVPALVELAREGRGGA